MGRLRQRWRFNMEYIVHRFFMSDSEDPDLLAAEPMYQWEHSEAGQFIMTHATKTPVWIRHTDISRYGYQYVIKADISPENYTFYKLKFL